jgi:ankyrin repeat protein
MKRPKLNSVFESVFSGDLATLKLAIEAGDDIDALDRDGRTPIFQAAIDGRVDILRELLRSGASIAHRDVSGRTPLHLAVIQGKQEVASALVQAGAPVNAPDNDGNTPLGDAVFYSEGRGEIIQMLRKHGADPLLRNNHGVSPKELAQSIGNYDLEQFLQ